MYLSKKRVTRKGAHMGHPSIHQHPLSLSPSRHHFPRTGSVVYSGFIASGPCSPSSSSSSSSSSSVHQKVRSLWPDVKEPHKRGGKEEDGEMTFFLVDGRCSIGARNIIWWRWTRKGGVTGFGGKTTNMPFAKS